MKTKALIFFGLLVAVVALPVALRRESAAVGQRQADDQLVILTPHNESICHEFGEAFAAYWRESKGRSIHIDWRTPGGTSEIRMMLDAGYKAAGETGRDGIGVDVLFGGGEPDFSSQEKKQRLVPLEVFDSHPEWFGENGVIPPSFTGEKYYSGDHRWVGVCLSQFGICYNPASLERLKLPVPVSWRDLGDPGYFGSLALADPGKSGSVARAFELLVQTEMLKALQKDPGHREAALDAGWREGLRLIQRLSANARYFTDSASKIPHDVGQGNAAAGMCIDFYGRSYAYELGSSGGRPRLVWIAPSGGTTLSADPVAVLKGAPHGAIAQEFVRFCLGQRAQAVWFGVPGAPGGPHERALYRLPIRRDMYGPEWSGRSLVPDARPYEDPGNFTYQTDLTGGSFHTLRLLVKIMCLDSHEELKSAWKAMREAGMPEDAVAVFSDVSIVPYAVSGDPSLAGEDAIASAARAVRIGEWFRANYRKAEALSKQHLRKGD